jgi:hypothetical protein
MNVSCTTQALGYGSPRKRIVLALLLGTPVLLLAQTNVAGRHTIRLEQVVAALDAAEVPLESAEVKLLAQNIASTAEPRLEVRGLEAVGAQGARVRMGCEAHEQCLPFYVGVTWADARIAKAALRSEFLPGSSPSSPDRSAPAARGSGENTQMAAKVASLAKGNEHGVREAQGPDVHPGSHATLLIDGQRLHIKLPVVCLEKGSPGHTIRVTSLDHKQTYLAEVIDSTLLKATL